MVTMARMAAVPSMVVTMAAAPAALVVSMQIVPVVAPVASTQADPVAVLVAPAVVPAAKAVHTIPVKRQAVPTGLPAFASPTLGWLTKHMKCAKISFF